MNIDILFQNLHVQNRKFGPVFSSSSFLNFIFNFILSCFFLYLKVYANEAESRKIRQLVYFKTAFHNS